jgi:hypothetical protein
LKIELNAWPPIDDPDPVSPQMISESTQPSINALGSRFHSATGNIFEAEVHRGHGYLSFGIE